MIWRGKLRYLLTYYIALGLSLFFFICCFYSSSGFTAHHATDQLAGDAVEIIRNKRLKRFNLATYRIPFLHESDLRCNTTILHDEAPKSECDSMWGWQLFDDWLKNQRLVVDNGSIINCAVNIGTHSFCKFTNVTIDFAKGKARGDSRVFQRGFFTTEGDMLNSKFDFDIPGRQHIMGTETSEVSNTKVVKDTFRNRQIIVESRPTFIISNDDNFNLGHYMNDVMNVWQMSVLAGRHTEDSLLINFDGFRTGGPAGGPINRLMVPSDVDCYGPYISYYNSWFAEIKKAVYYRSQKVKFTELYIPSNPYFPWFWNEWRSESKCASLAASPLYQSFNLFLRNQWSRKYGAESLPRPDLDVVHVVLELRPIDRNKTDEHSSARHIENAEKLISEMNLLSNVRITAQDFTALSFRDQVALSHSAGVFVSMHGAGTTHIFHSALGSPNCCALVELQPEERLGYRQTQGYGNLARMHGLHYYRYSASDGRTGLNGTRVAVKEVVSLVREAVAAVSRMPTCLGDVRDTREPEHLKFNWL
jgi:hypothetical protein